MTKPTPLLAWKIKCASCLRTVVVFHDTMPTDPPEGWFHAWGDEWTCPKHVHDYEYFEWVKPSEAAYTLVLDADDDWE